MNQWLIAATVLLCALAPVIVFAIRAPVWDAVVCLEVAGPVVTVVLVLLCEGFARSAYYVLPLVASAVTFVGSMVFVRFLARWV